MTSIIDRLNEKGYPVKQTGDAQFIAPCPAHDDKTPSLSIRVTDDQDLVYCQAGCDTLVILERLGLAFTDLFHNGTAPRSKRPAPPPRQGGSSATPAPRPEANGKKIVAEYDYGDFQVVRIEPGPDGKRKDFRQRRPDPDRPGEWIWNLDGVTRVMYRLDNVLAADEGVVIYVVEGEKDVDRLREDGGMIVTCCPGGAGKWHKINDEPLHGRTVVILPDNDETGRKHALNVAASLHGTKASRPNRHGKKQPDAVTSVKILTLSGLDEHGDVSDWLDDGHDVVELDELAERQPVWEGTVSTGAASAAPVSKASPAPRPTSRPDAEPTDTDDPTARADVVRMSTVQRKLVGWIWQNRIPLGKVTVVAGMQGAAKSLLTMDWTSRVSTGKSWPDDCPNERGSVVHLSVEDDEDDTIGPRLDAAGADSNRVYLFRGVKEIDGTGTRIFSVTQDIRILRDVIEDIGDVRLVVIDPLTAYLGENVNEWKDGEVRRALAPLGELAREFNIAVVCVMHLRKSTSDKALFRVAGSIAFTAYARCVLFVGKDENEETDEEFDRYLLPLKLNVGKPAPGLKFTIAESTGEFPAGVVKWGGSTDRTPDDVMQSPARHPDEASPKVREATDFLLTYLSENGEQKKSDILRAAREQGIRERTIDRAKAGLGDKVKAVKPGFAGHNAAWYWTLTSEEVPG